VSCIKFAIKLLIFAIAAAVLAFALASLTVPYIKEPQQITSEKAQETYSDFFYDYEVTRYPSSADIISVENFRENLTIGISVDNWNLDFGEIPANGSYGKRFLNLTNRDEDAKIHLIVYGEISPMVKFNRNNFVLLKDQKVTVEVYFNTSTYPAGIYNGEIDIVVQKPKSDIGKFFWG
jgi:hypothetical protein